MDAILLEYLNSSANKPLVKFCSQCGNDLIEAEIDGRIRLTCTSDECNYVFWDPPTPVVAAVVEFARIPDFAFRLWESKRDYADILQEAEQGIVFFRFRQLY